MVRHGRRLYTAFAHLRPLALALPLLAGCCVEGTTYSNFLAPNCIVRGAMPDDDDDALPAEERSPSTPPGAPALPSSPPSDEGRDAPAGPKLVPICLDTVLRLAEEQNTQIGLARARVDQACAELDLAGKRWLPDLYVGTAWYRHEGGIQLENGDLIHSSTGATLSGVDLHGKLDLREAAYQKVVAERKSWQQQGELSRITNENLLDAAGTYFDLLTARTGEAIARDLEKDLRDLLPQAEKMAKNEPAAEVEVERIHADIEARRQNQVKLRAQAEAASAKLVYLLGLDPCVQLLPVDKEIVPIDLVDATKESCELVGQALAHGPGVHELGELVNLVENAIQKAKGPGRFMPIVEMHMIEGAFGAGPGSRLDYDNRWDLCLSVRWNLTDFCTSKERLRVAETQRQQAHLAYQDLRAKLTAGVQESRTDILSGREEIRIGKSQIQHARKARELSKTRVDKMVPGATAGEVLLSLQSLAFAQLGHVGAVRDHNKAQLRLMLLVGCRAAAPVVEPVPAEGQLPKADGKGQ